jgi:hypothetical protein
LAALRASQYNSSSSSIALSSSDVALGSSDVALSSSGSPLLRALQAASTPSSSVSSWTAAASSALQYHSRRSLIFSNAAEGAFDDVRLQPPV